MLQRLKAKVLILLLSSFVLPVMAKETTTPLDDYKPIKITEHAWAIFGPLGMPNAKNQGFMNNPVFVETKNSVIVLDPGSTVHVGRGILKKIRKITNKPVTHVFNSHIHGDHWLANQAFKEANPDVKIYAHPNMIEEAKNGQAESWITLIENLTEGASKGTFAEIPGIALENGQVIEIDNIKVKAHLSDLAHTKTDAMFEVLTDKLLITGDNVFHKRLPRLDDGSFKGNIAAIELAKGLDVDVIVPGHGPSGGKEVLTRFKSFLGIIYDTSRELYEDDMEDYEMKPAITKKLSDYINWDSFKDNIGKLISLAVLEVENDE